MTVTPDIEKMIEKAWLDYNDPLGGNVDELFFGTIKTLIESLPRYDWSKKPKWANWAATIWSEEAPTSIRSDVSFFDAECHPTPPPWKPTTIDEPYLWRQSPKHIWQPGRRENVPVLDSFEYRPFDLELMFRTEEPK